MMRLQQQHFTPRTTTVSQQQPPPLSNTSPYVNSSSSLLLKKNNVVELDSSYSTNGSSKSTSSTSAIIIQPNAASSSTSQPDSSSLFLVTGSGEQTARKITSHSNQQEKFSKHPMNSTAISTLQRFQQQQQQLIGTPTGSNRRTTMYRLSSFNESSSSSSPPPPLPTLSSSTNNGGVTNELPLMTPTYESIDVHNLIDSHHSTFHDPTTTSATIAASAAVYVDSSQGTSDGGHEESNGCMSDNPTVTVPDNHRLYPGANGSQHHYYSRTASSIMPMSGIMTPLAFTHHHHHNHNHHYPLASTGGGYLTRSSHYYYHHPDYYYYGSQTNASNTSPPLLYGRDIDGSGSSSLRPLSSFNKDEDFDIFNAIFALISLMSHCCCSGSTFILAYFLWRHEQDMLLFWLTIFATVVPSIIVNVISLKW